MLIRLTFKDTDHSKNGSKQRICLKSVTICCFQLWNVCCCCLEFTSSQLVDPVQYHLRTSYMPSPAFLPLWALIKLQLYTGIVLSRTGDIKGACGMGMGPVASYSQVGGKKEVYTPTRKLTVEKSGKLDSSIGLIKVHFRWEESYKKKWISELNTEISQPG